MFSWSYLHSRTMSLMFRNVYYQRSYAFVFFERDRPSLVLVLKSPSKMECLTKRGYYIPYSAICQHTTIDDRERSPPTLFIKLFRSDFHTEQCSSVCCASSRSSSQWWHCGVIARPIRWSYLLKQPCPVSTWVNLNIILPVFLPNQVSKCEQIAITARELWIDELWNDEKMKRNKNISKYFLSAFSLSLKVKKKTLCF